MATETVKDTGEIQKIGITSKTNDKDVADRDYNIQIGGIWLYLSHTNKNVEIAMFEIGDFVDYEYHKGTFPDGKPSFTLHRMTHTSEGSVKPPVEEPHGQQQLGTTSEVNEGKPPESTKTVAVVPKVAALESVDQAVSYWNTYQQLTQKILNDSDYQDIGDKKFKKKSAWRKYMRFYNISTAVVKENVVKGADGMVVEAMYIVRATAPSGQSVEAVGFCDVKEPNLAKRMHSLKNHDILATAQTRATSRAVSDIIGAGEVSAEEMGE